MQVSGGRLLSPVQKLVTTSIFLSCGGKEKCKSSPALRTKETVERLSLFCQSILAKTVKTPGIPIKRESQGLFCSLQAIHVYLQLFPSIFVDPVDDRATEQKSALQMTAFPQD